ncbi:MAG: hypothetical protein M3Q33_08840 [Acidobacteriota bacterium]|nr:hypothetical protein [Acidobacteriota bacterium]
MEIAFDAIGIEIKNETAFNNLAEDVGKRGEISRLTRKSGVLHGRCLKLGEGLEVWTVLYESGTGEVFYAHCRPGFRARYAQKISPWILTEFDEEGEAVIHGFVGHQNMEVLFALQNLTEVGTRMFEQSFLHVGLCGLAYRAEVSKKAETPYWKPFDEITLDVIANENDWSLGGTVIAFNALRNPFSGSDLYWLYLDLGELKLEVLVSRHALKGAKLQTGAFIKADIWLQGHILNETAFLSAYEGVDWSYQTVDFWKKFKRNN